ncbi:uncharacterized protein [Cicer arietinum]|uniref:Uncharacterized protein LOC105852303 n=1 Tax=Cicer arietinum TaxID=3827 RepID=A0A1S3EA39_CICAR|nr:uncharacterized protein LOC105852303 [Cicer arietinum]
MVKILWMKKNHLIFSRTPFDHEQILKYFNRQFSSIHHRLYLFPSSFKEDCKRKINVRWYPLNVNAFKLNIDSSYHETPSLAACGMLIRDHKGVYIIGFFCNLSQDTFVPTEFLGLVHGL